MHEGTFGGGAPPGPAGGAYVLSTPSSRNGGLLLRRRGGEGLLIRESEGAEGKEKDGGRRYGERRGN